MRNIKAIIFDMDGVIVDSQSFLDIYEYKYYKKITNNAWTKKEQLSIHGMSIKEIHRFMKSKYKINTSLNSFINKYDEILEFIYKHKCKLIHGVRKLINESAKENYKVALASSTSHKFIDKVLKRFKLKKYFNEVISGDDTPGKSKPQPDIFLLTAKKLSTKPINCLVFEDSNNGVTAAKKAGMFCIQLSNKQKSDKPGPDLHIKTFKNIKLSRIIKEIF